MTYTKYFSKMHMLLHFVERAYTQQCFTRQLLTERFECLHDFLTFAGEKQTSQKH